MVQPITVFMVHECAQLIGLCMPCMKHSCGMDLLLYSQRAGTVHEVVWFLPYMNVCLIVWYVRTLILDCCDMLQHGLANVCFHALWNCVL